VLLLSGLKLDYIIELTLSMLRQVRAHCAKLLSPHTWLAALSAQQAPVSPSSPASPQLPLNIFNRRASISATNAHTPPSLQTTQHAPGQSQVVQTIGPDKRPRVGPEAEDQWALAGGLLPVARLLEEALERWLPPDAHLRCSGKLGVSVTRMSWWCENEFVCHFRSRDELIRAVCAGCFIPIWSGSLWGPKFRQRHCMDGAYSDNGPKFPPPSSQAALRCGSRFVLGHTVSQISLSPFSCDVEVCPSDEDTYTWLEGRCTGNLYKANRANLSRAVHAMLPHSLATYRQYFLSGHREMKAYLFRSNMIKCRRCFQLASGLHDVAGGHSSAIAAGLLEKGATETETVESETTTKTKTTKTIETTTETTQTETEIDTVTTSQPKTISEPCLRCLKLLERVDSLKINDQLLALFDD